ncbi:MAG TPA: transketolase [Drouetiella sp.]
MVEVQFAKTQTIQQLGAQLRVDSIRATTAAGSGHPTSCMSAADLMAVLMVKYLKFDFEKPEYANNDRLIFSKGHAAPLLYAMYKAAGVVSDEEMLTLRKFGSRLEGHPVPKIIPWVDVATGSLGQGLPVGVGMALNGKYLDKQKYRVWTLLGDSEMAEGSVWEALMSASYYKLDNMTAILDMNRLGQRGETELGWDSRTYAERARAFGWNVIEINGHDYDQIDEALGKSIACTGQPTFIVAKTEKGHGFPEIANKDGWHGKPLSAEQATQAIEVLGGIQNSVIKVQKPEPISGKLPSDKRGTYEAPKYDKPIATREAYGDALKALGACQENIVALDAEVGNSTYSEKFGKAYMDRFFEMFIAEQLMVGAAVGLQTRDKVPFASTFAAFLSRSFDFIRMAAISRARLCLAGSHAGVSIGQDGPSQMALEDLSMMRSVFESIVLYPSDGTSTAALLELMADYKGISYMRTTREKTPILYKSGEKFEVGGSKVLKSSKEDKATLIGAGITLHECVKAYEQLQKEGINVRVIDLYSVKPVDAKTIKAAASETGTLIVVEDHWAEGGLGDAVLEVFSCAKTWQGANTNGGGSGAPRVIKLAVTAMPGSGAPDELMDAAGISAKHIVDAVKSVKA